jgi:primosomal protein N' (replication factor Y)
LLALFTLLALLANEITQPIPEYNPLLKLQFWAKAHFMRFANVAIPSPIRGPLTYSLPEGVSAKPGMRALVPFHRRKTIGLVIDVLEELPADAMSKSIRDVHEIMDPSPVMDPHLIKLIGWMASYYCTPIGEVVRASLPARMIRPSSPKTTRPATPHEISPIHADEIFLNADQQEALRRVTKSDGRPDVFLLHGVTGSGKTEVYLRIFAELAKRGKHGLLLVPEIGLTSQLTGRAAARFGDRVAVYHSGLTDAQRHRQWSRMRDGEVDVVIGTRSAIFAPFTRLGAIVVDEEHDSSYKQDEGLTYHGRDCAVMRAHIESIPIILGSATPSLESISNARHGKYELLSLPTRTGEASMPDIELVDMRIPNSGKGIAKELTSLSPKLHRAIDETLSRGEQALLFLGRRGFSAVHCEECGEAIRCPNCDIALTSHMGGGSGPKERLVCHYCDYSISQPASCPSCGEDGLAPIGQGTQRLEAEISDFFPKARVARLDSDMAASQKERRRIFDGMRKGTIDILVGTQMVTKGHDFPNVTLVGVISADQSLHLPDFRAAERTFQLLTQVAGRAGRASRPGQVVIQTYEPTHPSLEFSLRHDFDAFASQELESREALCYPPFSRIANIRLSSIDSGLAERSARETAELIKGDSNVGEIRILGPAPAPIEKLRGRYRWQILMKAPSARALSSLLASSIPKIEAKLPRKVRLNVDVDPSSLL